MKPALSILLALALCCSAWAEWPYDAICAISLSAPDGGNFGGSGTLVGIDDDGNGLILSAAHVFDEGNTRDIACRFPAVSMEWTPARLVEVGRNDIAVLVTKAPSIQLPRSVRVPKKDDGPFVIAGYPSYSRTKLRFSTGDFIGFVDRGGEVQVTGHSNGGMSGGAIFNRHGDLVGVISGNKAERVGAPWDRVWGASGATFEQVVGKYIKVQR